jgi:UDP-2,3-diacylglucosamine pyrophosphatase LpxH
MLSLVSDLHLTDGPDPADPRIRHLIHCLVELAERGRKRGFEDFSIAFLGDIFDILHSQQWLERKLRPWEPVSGQHRELVRDIYRNIREHNQPFFQGLHQLKDTYPQVQFHFLPGNHDHVLNTDMGILARQEMIAESIFEHSGPLFQDTLIFPEYRTMARHGHECDPTNIYALGRAAVGDYVVIDILEQLPRLIADDLNWPVHDARLKFFRQLSYVVPQDTQTMVGWIFAGITELERSEPRIRASVENACAAIFKGAETLLRHEPEKFLLPRQLQKLLYVLSWKLVREGGRWIKPRTVLHWAKRLKFSFAGEPVDYRVLLESQTNFVGKFLDFEFLASGHTHAPQVGRSADRRRQFFNTGAWGRIYQANAAARFASASFDCLDGGAVAVIYSREELRRAPDLSCRLERSESLGT